MLWSGAFLVRLRAFGYPPALGSLFLRHEPQKSLIKIYNFKNRKVRLRNTACKRDVKITFFPLKLVYHCFRIDNIILDPDPKWVNIQDPDPKSQCIWIYNSGYKCSLLCRDRQLNQQVYPALYYPEVYLLHLGYKEFFNSYPDLCTGRYTTMVDPNYEVSQCSL